ncbi:MAG: dihydrolipoyl dehydrogenase [Candidatus Cloacimonetes bacterium]|nr:dihydrolipoyl dehydrogenase [Candidatus Cloacimonadota bacterium]
MIKYSVGIIGGGPGGYVAGIRLEQLGVKCVVFEKERLGGVCLNWGCIPTKALVKVADQFQEFQVAVQEGYLRGTAAIDFSEVKVRQKKIVEQLVGGIEYIYDKRKIALVINTVEVIKATNAGYEITAGGEQYSVDYLIIATGSKPKSLPFMPFDGERILSSRDLLSLEILPQKLVVVGGGVIGCEFACIFRQLGVEMEIVEFLPSLIAMEDEEVGKRLSTSFKKMKIKLHTKTAVEGYEYLENGIRLLLSNGKTLEADKVLVSVGREPLFEIKCEGFELQRERGFVTIDEEMRSNNSKIFAIGDVTGKLMLAHAASKQAVMAAETIYAELNKVKSAAANLRYENIPRCTYTNPEIGSAGLTEAEAREKYGEIETGRFMFAANGKALTQSQTTGFVKVIAEKTGGRIVGMHIIGPSATELIGQGGILLGLEADMGKVKKIVFAHPTLSEAIGEALEDLEGLALHKI